MKCIFGLLLVLLLEVQGLWGLRATLNALPSVVRRGEHVVLQCLYDLQGARLYVVRWYRGKHEFFRFMPEGEPVAKAFNVSTIHVDLSLSNCTQVVLRDLEFTLSGNFSCEVSADSPSFSTAFVTTHIDVVELPSSGPVIHAERNEYGPGDLLQANCTVGPSHPAANLTFLINNQVMSLASRFIHESKDNKEWSEVAVSVPLAPLHFRNGRLVLRCLAQLHPLYVESATAFYSALIDPKSERITSGAVVADTLIGNIYILSLLAVFYILMMAYEYDDISFDYTDYETREFSKELKSALIG